MIHLRNSDTRYGLLANLGHWTSVALVAAIFIGISGHDVPPKLNERASVLATHVSLGVALLAVMCARFAWRLGNPNPLLSYPLAPWHRSAALTAHRSLYVIVVVEALLGLCMLLAAGDDVVVFGQTLITASDNTATAAADFSRAAHASLSTALLVLIACHVVAAVFNKIFAPPE